MPGTGAKSVQIGGFTFNVHAERAARLAQKALEANPDTAANVRELMDSMLQGAPRLRTDMGVIGTPVGAKQRAANVMKNLENRMKLVEEQAKSILEGSVPDTVGDIVTGQDTHKAEEPITETITNQKIERPSF